MGTAYLGAQHPVIAQENDELVLKDRGDWFTQEGERVARENVLWQRQLGNGGWEQVGGTDLGKPHTRTESDKRLSGEDAKRLKISKENAGRTFRALVWGGVDDQWDGGTKYVAWGSTDGSHRNDEVSSSYSNVLTVEPSTLPTPPPTPTPAKLHPNPGAVSAVWQNVVLPQFNGPSTILKKWRQDNQGEYGELVGYAEKIMLGQIAPTPMVRSPIGLALIGLLEMASWYHGTHD